MKDIADIVKAMTDSTYSYSVKNEVIQCVVTNEVDLVRQISWLHDIANELIGSSKLLFSVNYLTHGRKVLSCHGSSNLGEQFLSVLRNAVPAVRRHFPDHRLNPLVELLISSVIDRQLDGVDLQPKMLLEYPATQIVDTLNGCVSTIREHGKSRKFKSALDRFSRSARKNHQGLLAYINALCDKYARLLVLRIDLGYREGMFFPNGADGVQVMYPDVRSHRQKLMRHLNSPGHCMVGFALKLEYGLKKGFHYHLLLFLDGSKVREDVTIAKLIGEYWNKEITGGRGLHFNCNALKSGYKCCGIGMLHYSDAIMMEGLRKAAFYMTKTDYLIQFMAHGKDRIFWKGTMPKSKSARGRPRSKMVNAPSVVSGNPPMRSYGVI